ncbi:MAG: hypothetical protein HS116_15775 [Planctomycetes bacterium]|nr:hypothetical protein [Planctomycetota bacterium]
MKRSRIHLLASVCLAAGLLAGLAACSRSKRAAIPAADAAPPAQALILSGKQTSVYHFCTCPYAKDIAEKDQLGFANPAAAERQGKIRCTFCKPYDAFEEYQRARAVEDAKRTESAATPAPASTP